MQFRFEWDEAKNRINQKKHGVSFEEAKTVFFDDHALEFYDDTHSEWEARYLLLGLSIKYRMLLVCHCERGAGDIIRIISARKATNKERKHYLDQEI
jgi:uncharacterized protein